jgi:hypothetical protein
MLQITPKALKLIRMAQERANVSVRSSRGGAGTERARKLNRRRFDELVDDVAKILKLGQPTAFAFEGACRHGIRSRLCLDGWSWMDADAAAADVLSASLSQIGMTRPTWWQGQPEYADTDTSRGFCSYRRCGRPIPIERGIRNGKPVKYCSDHCGHMVHAETIRRDGHKFTLAEYLAACSARTAETLRTHSRNCDQCGTFFATSNADRKYCSRGCFFKAAKKLQDRNCLQCGETFSPKNSGAKGVSRYCSRGCAAAGRKKARPALTCVTCTSVFYAQFPSDKRRYCSPSCNPFASKAAKSAFRCDEAG